MEKIVCIGSLKGGVGKTTTAVNLGAALANLGKRTLIVDGDQQGSATVALGVERSRIKGSLGRALRGHADLADLVLRSGVEHLHIIPSSSRDRPFELDALSEPGRELLLRRLLREIAGPYDAIVIDTPPARDFMSISALNAADSLLIPLPCEFLAYESLIPYLRFVRGVRERDNNRLWIRGVLLTMYNDDQHISRRIVASARRNLNGLVFDTIIPQSVRLQELASTGKPLLAVDAESTDAMRYLALAREVLARRRNGWK